MAVAWKVPPQTLPAPSLRRGLGLQPSQDAFDPPQHLGGRAAGEGEQQDPPRVGAAGDAVRHPVGEGGRLARAGSGDDEQRLVAVLDRKALPVVQFGQDVVHGKCWHGGLRIQWAADRRGRGRTGRAGGASGEAGSLQWRSHVHGGHLAGGFRSPPPGSPRRPTEQKQTDGAQERDPRGHQVAGGEGWQRVGQPARPRTGRLPARSRGTE